MDPMMTEEEEEEDALLTLTSGLYLTLRTGDLFLRIAAFCFPLFLFFSFKIVFLFFLLTVFSLNLVYLVS